MLPGPAVHRSKNITPVIIYISDSTIESFSDANSTVTIQEHGRLDRPFFTFARNARIRCQMIILKNSRISQSRQSHATF